MASSSSSELTAVKKSMNNILGETMKIYLYLLKSWFNQKLTREEFDLEARKLMPNKEAIHVHNQFLLAIMTKCSMFGSSLTAVKEPSPKKKHKAHSSKVSHQLQHFAPANPLSAAVRIECKAPDPDQRNIGFASRELTLPDLGMVHGRMIVTAWDFGMDDVDEEAVKLVYHAVEVQLKNIITAVCARRSGYKVREGRFKYAMGTVQPSVTLRNTLNIADDSQESEATSISNKGAHIPCIKPSVETGYRDAAVQLACAGDVAVAKGPITLFDLLDALQVNKSAIPSHSVYATNVERIINRLWHPSNKEIAQEQIHQQEVRIKADLQAQHRAAIDDKAVRGGLS